MSRFLTALDVRNLLTEKTWKLLSPLVYESDLIGEITVPTGFVTDLASVPRVPIVFMLWGDRAHHEAVIHDYLYRSDSYPLVPFELANRVFLEAMQCRNKPWWIRCPIYWGVCIGGRHSYHKKAIKNQSPELGGDWGLEKIDPHHSIDAIEGDEGKEAVVK